MLDAVRAITAEQSAQLDVAWDVIHGHGWEPEHVEMRKSVVHNFDRGTRTATEEHRQMLVIRANPVIGKDLSVFQVTTVFGMDAVHVTAVWLALVPDNDSALRPSLTR